MKRKNLEIGIFKALFHNVPHKELSQKLGVIYDEFGPLPVRIKKVISFLKTLR